MENSNEKENSSDGMEEDLEAVSIGRIFFFTQNFHSINQIYILWYGLNRGKRKASRDIGYEAQVMLVTRSEASKLKDS